MRQTLWLVDWSDEEDDDFKASAVEAGVEVRVLRVPALGTTVGTRLHRLRSWPSYAGLALAGLASAKGSTVVAWQPLAGAIAGLVRPRRGRPPLVVLNPLLESGGPPRGSPADARLGGSPPDTPRLERKSGRRQRFVLAGLRRAEHVVFFSRAGLEVAAGLGLDANRLTFVPLGVRARRAAASPPGRYVVAAGREHRDWETLLEAARGIDIDVRVVGPERLVDAPPSVTLLPQMPRREFLDLLEGAAALVVPLSSTGRSAGQLAVLDAMSVGRAVVATRAQGTEDYVSEETGVLVPPADPAALRAAMEDVARPGRAETLGAAALVAARGHLSLTRFVAAIESVSAAAARGPTPGPGSQR